VCQVGVCPYAGPEPTPEVIHRLETHREAVLGVDGEIKHCLQLTVCRMQSITEYEIHGVSHTMTVLNGQGSDSISLGCIP
jgi:hypothetical protein